MIDEDDFSEEQRLIKQLDKLSNKQGARKTWKQSWVIQVTTDSKDSRVYIFEATFIISIISTCEG